MTEQASAELRLKELGIVLPTMPEPSANFVRYRIEGNLLFLSGQGARDQNGALLTGKVGADVTLEEANRRARTIGLGLLAVARDALGSLDRINAVLKVFGMVNAVPEFADHPKVIDGCSDVLVEVLGDAGKHARTAVGMNLPAQIAVEIEALFSIKAER